MSKRPGLSALKDQIARERQPLAMVGSAPASATPVTTDDAKTEAAPVTQTTSPAAIAPRGRRYPTYREGKVPIGGYFSPELSRALHQMALDESELGKPRVKIQALLGEAIDLLLRSRNKSAFGER